MFQIDTLQTLRAKGSDSRHQELQEHNRTSRLLNEEHMKLLLKLDAIETNVSDGKFLLKHILMTTLVTN